MNSWRRFKQWLANGLDIISLTVKSLSSDPLAWESAIQKFEARELENDL